MRKKILIFFLLLSSYLFSNSPLSFAYVECGGKASDESGNGLEGVAVIFTIGGTTTQTEFTSADGRYSKLIAGDFGVGAGAVSKVEFNLDGYSSKIFDYIPSKTNTNPSTTCPGDVTLTKTDSKTNFGCYGRKDENLGYVASCMAEDMNLTGDLGTPVKIYGDKNSCNADCAPYQLDLGRGFCRPADSNAPIAAVFYSKSQCEEELSNKQLPPDQKEKLYKYTPAGCIEDPKGVPLDQCKKESQAKKPTPTPFPLPPPCDQFIAIGADGKPTGDIWTKEQFEEKIRKGEFGGDSKDIKNFKCAQVKTALGDFYTKPEEFVAKIMSLILGLSGGIAVLLIIVSGYRLMASQGNPEKVQGAKESLTSAIVGLLFIIFALVILQVIGVDILRIPGFK